MNKFGVISNARTRSCTVPASSCTLLRVLIAWCPASTSQILELSNARRPGRRPAPCDAWSYYWSGQWYSEPNLLFWLMHLEDMAKLQLGATCCNRCSNSSEILQVIRKFSKQWWSGISGCFHQSSAVDVISLAGWSLFIMHRGCSAFQNLCFGEWVAMLLIICLICTRNAH